MASLVLTIHSKTPELRKISKVIEALESGAVILYPSDTGFSLGCALSKKEAIQRIRLIKQIPDSKYLTFLCDSLSNVAEFAKVSNLAYKTIKRLIPGPYTFILPASKMVPRYAQDPKRKTAGIRVPDNIICKALLKSLNMPIISISAKKSDTDTLQSPEDIIKFYTPLVDVAVLSDEYNFAGESTIIDMTSDEFTLIRKGAGFAKVAELIENEEDTELKIA